MKTREEERLAEGGSWVERDDRSKETPDRMKQRERGTCDGREERSDRGKFMMGGRHVTNLMPD